MSEKTFTVKINKIIQVTHDVKCFKVDKPEGFEFTPGQATEVSINKDGWKDKKRAFTFASLNSDKDLEFVIKIYNDHDGVTKQIGELKEGDEFIIREPWGAIHYKGPGVFIAGGAGVTPFIAILRQLKKDGKLDGNTLIFSNKTEEDIIMHDEFDSMHDLKRIYTLTRENNNNYGSGRINSDFLKTHVKDFSQLFYICGPVDMVGELHSLLQKLGASSEAIVVET